MLGKQPHGTQPAESKRAARVRVRYMIPNIQIPYGVRHELTNSWRV